MATTINAGRVRFVSRGTYNNSTQYYLFDLVDYNGSSYIAKENTVGNLPTNTTYWQLIAEKGNTGNTGQTGPVGATGNGIASIIKTATVGLVDTYTITYTNGNTTTFTVTNGEDGEVTETELDVLRQQIEDLENNQLTETPTISTSYHFVDSAKAKYRRFLPEGHSDQKTTDGRNLWGGITYTYNKDGMNIIQHEDGSMYANGTATKKVNSLISSEAGPYLKTLQPNTYTISANIINGKIELVSSSGTVLETVNSGNPSKTVTIENETQIFIRLVVESGTTINNENIFIQLEEGSTKHEWEPFTNGASPNPSYEQPIKSAGDNIQLFDKDNVTEGYYYGSNGSLATSTNWCIEEIEVQPNSNYYLSGNNYNNTSAKIVLLDANKGFISVVGDYYNTHLITTTTQTHYIGLSIADYNGTGDMDTIKLAKGNQATPWSPYGMGSITEKIINENWLDENYQQGGLQLGSDGSEAGQANRVRTDFTPITASETYKITNYNDIVNNLGIGYYDKNKEFISAEASGGWISFPYTLTTPINAKYVRFAFRKSTNENITPDLDYKIILNKGSSSIPYIPHEEQTYTIPVQAPFRSIGDVRDVFFKNTVDSPYYDENLTLNSWYERHYIQEIVADGINYKCNYMFTNGRFVLTDSNGQEYRVALPVTSSSNLGKILCNHLIPITRTQIESSNMMGIAVSTVKQIWLKLDNATSETNTWTKDSINEYLQGNPFVINVELEEPLDLPCTEEQTQQLENRPYTYKTETNVNSEDEVEAYIDLEYVLDLKTYIDNN